MKLEHLAWSWLVLICGLALVEWLWKAPTLMALVCAFPHQPLAVLALVVLVLTWRSGAGARAATVLSLLVIVLLMGFNLPLGGRNQQGTPVRVMTLNMQGLPFGIKPTVKAIRREAADIVALQEVSIWNQEMAEQLRPGPEFELAQKGEFALYSRYPILESELLLDSSRPGQRSLLAVGERKLVVWNLHYSVLLMGFASFKPGFVDKLAADDAWRARQTNELVAQLKKETEPYVLMGDLNAPSREHSVAPLLAYGRDAFASRGWGFGFTYDAAFPVLRIDYILVSPGLGVNACWLEREYCSDHRGVRAELVLLGDVANL